MKEIDHLLSSYRYELPRELIAQHPAERRDQSRLMVTTPTGQPTHHRFSDIVSFIRPSDTIVINDTKVFPARLFGRKQTGGKVEIFLLEYPVATGKPATWASVGLVRASKRPKPGTVITVSDSLTCSIIRELEDSKLEIHLQLRTVPGATYPPLDPEAELNRQLQELGQVPLPPYIERHEGTTEEDRKRYQTVYADKPGAVAAPTAGLHFTDTLLETLRSQGTGIATVTLHVGYGTFAPVRSEDITSHQIHSEYLSVPESTIATIRETRNRGGRIWAVGTTCVRSLEFAACKNDLSAPFKGWCDLYIYPGFRFRVVDNLITNFHLPDSSLMFLVAALLGREKLLECYRTAVTERYRFFSYGDAMAIIRR